MNQYNFLALENAIKESCTPANCSINDDYKSLQKEFNMFESTGKIIANLKLLLDALKSIQPTSTESERVFSLTISFASRV